MTKRKYFYYIAALGWDGFFGPYESKEDAIKAARKDRVTNFYITYGTETIDFLSE